MLAIQDTKDQPGMPMPAAQGRFNEQSLRMLFNTILDSHQQCLEGHASTPPSTNDQLAAAILQRSRATIVCSALDKVLSLAMIMLAISRCTDRVQAEKLVKRKELRRGGVLGCDWGVNPKLRVIKDLGIVDKAEEHKLKEIAHFRHYALHYVALEEVYSYDPSNEDYTPKGPYLGLGSPLSRLSSVPDAMDRVRKLARAIENYLVTDTQLLKRMSSIYSRCINLREFRQSEVIGDEQVLAVCNKLQETRKSSSTQAALNQIHVGEQWSEILK